MIRCSVSRSPKSLTSSAPETVNRSVMVADISAFWVIRSRDSPASLVPTIRAGTMKIGSNTSAARVSGQDSASIDASTSTSVMELLTTVDSVEVNACWAPLTSDCSRDTSFPVCERLKNAMGIRSMWSKIWVRIE